MRILMLTQFYSPIVGGGAIHARALSIELAARGHDVALVTLRHPGQTEFELDEGVRVYRVHSSMGRMAWLFRDERRQYAPPFPDPEVTLALRRIITRERPEIVHAHNWLVYSFLPLKAWSGARLIVTLHSYDLACAKTTLLYDESRCGGPGFPKCLACAAQCYGAQRGVPIVLGHWVMDLIRRRAVDMFLPVSQAAAVGNGLVGSRLPFQVIPNFLPDEVSALQQDPEPYLAQLPAEDYLLFVGRFSPHKGLDVLLRAYAGLVETPPLVVLGYPSPEWSIASVDHPANVHIFQHWPRYAILAAWRRCLIALAPSVVPETFGLVVLEAMAAGCPVIASRIGGIVDLVADRETGLLVPPGDSAALQQAIERLLSDPDLRRCMGQAALRKAADFKANKVVPRIERVYEKLLHGDNRLSGLAQVMPAKLNDASS